MEEVFKSDPCPYTDLHGVFGPVIMKMKFRSQGKQLRYNIVSMYISCTELECDNILLHHNGQYSQLRELVPGCGLMLNEGGKHYPVQFVCFAGMSASLEYRQCMSMWWCTHTDRPVPIVTWYTSLQVRKVRRRRTSKSVIGELRRRKASKSTSGELKSHMEGSMLREHHWSEAMRMQTCTNLDEEDKVYYLALHVPLL